MAYGNRALGKRIISSPLAILALLIVLVILARSSWNIYGKARSTETKLAQAQSDLADLQAEQQALSDKVAYLSTDEGMQAELREKYRAVEPGEQVAVIIDATGTDADAPATSTPSEGWWHSFLEFFGL